MKPHNRIHQLSAFSLILLFSIQAGLGLWLHTTCHQQSTKSSVFASATGATVHQNEEFSTNCSCLLDFLTPFTWPANTGFDCPIQQEFSTIRSANYGFISHAICSYCLLRGPPVCYSF